MLVASESRPTSKDVSADWWARPGRAALVLGLVLFAFLLATDTGGFLATDVGGKMATLEAMDRRGDWSPDLGYWAEDLDPDGSLYPMASTSHVGDTWINVTSLPMIFTARPLYAVGGGLAVGVIPLLGTVLAALAARSISRRLGGDGVMAFWLVGLASPATIYALDFWEHAPALALMMWGVVHAMDASEPDGSWRSALLSGLVLGLAAAMRQEAILYGVVIGAALALRLLLSGRFLTMLGRCVAYGGAALTMVGANTLIEWWVIGKSTRSTRVSGTFVAGGGDPLLRFKEAVITGISPFAQATTLNIAIAIILAFAMVQLGLRAERPEAQRPYLLIGGAVLALWIFDNLINGLGFTPGLVATTPVAALVAGRVWRDERHRLVGLVALGTMPLVWVFGYTGGAGPQWGGRYLLLSGALLITAAPTLFTSTNARTLLTRVAVIGFAITMAGVTFAAMRTHSNADAMRALADRDEQVILFNGGHRAREAGALNLDEQWFVTATPETRAEAGELLLDAGFTRIAYVGGWLQDSPPEVPGWTVVDKEYVPLMGDLVLAVSVMEPSG